jgi:hypothetical protein
MTSEEPQEYMYVCIYVLVSRALRTSKHFFSLLRRFEQDEAIQEEVLALGIRVPNSLWILLFKRTQELHGGGFYYCSRHSRSFTRAGSWDQDSGAESGQGL